MSPEQINELRYNEKSDIWSAGCLFYEIASLRPPFEATNHLSLAIKIKSGKFDRLPIRYSEELQSLIGNMVNINSEQRPTVSELLTLTSTQLRIKEIEIKEKHLELKQKED
jgi:NIMA (never in mitosis gene a)-related kinase